jgi:hypothetical protein
LDSLRLRLETEKSHNKREVETLSVGDLKDRFPRVADVVAKALAEAIRTDREVPSRYINVRGRRWRSDGPSMLRRITLGGVYES